MTNSTSIPTPVLDPATSGRDQIKVTEGLKPEFEKWIQDALDKSRLTQAELARRVTDRIGRHLDRAQVNKLTKGGRTLLADEMIAISEITGLPPPGCNRAAEAGTSERGPGPAGPDGGIHPHLDAGRLERLAAATLEELGHPKAQSRDLASAWIITASGPPPGDEKATAQWLVRLFPPLASSRRKSA